MARSLQRSKTLVSIPVFQFISNFAVFAVSSASVLLLSGCGSIKYFWQAGEGQLSLLSHAKPISEVVREEKTPFRTKALLAEIPQVKKFGEKNGLKPTTNYTEYVKLDRPAAVWVVSACESTQFRSKEWNFPLIGSFPYLGWFDLKNANEYADSLRKEGWDVDVRGASAYSTLGWFRDAVLSTMISDGQEALGDLVNVVIHESVHATVYIVGQAYFNESIASYVADRLTPTYLTETRGTQSEEQKAYQANGERAKTVFKRLHELYLKLDKIYASTTATPDKLVQKQALIVEAQTELKLRRPLNNASLVQFKTYSTGSAEFDELFQACESKWDRFLSAAKSLKSSSFSKSQQEDLKEPLSQAVIVCRSYAR